MLLVYGRTWSAAAMLTTLALLSAGCMQRADPEAWQSSTTTTVASTVPNSGRCSESFPAPTVLDRVAGSAGVDEIIQRASGELVAIGNVADFQTPALWTRAASGGDWRPGTAPGADGEALLAMAEGHGEVVIASGEATDSPTSPHLYRSPDLVSWSEVAFSLDGAPATVTINSLFFDGARWVALAQGRSQIRIITSDDASSWTTFGARDILHTDGSQKDVLFDAAGADGTYTSVGFAFEDELRPLVAVFAAGADPMEHVLRQGNLDGLRLWSMAIGPDGRPLLASDIVADDGESATPYLYQLRGDPATGAGLFLQRITRLCATGDFASAVDLVVVDDHAVVVGAQGRTNQDLEPVIWDVPL